MKNTIKFFIGVSAVAFISMNVVAQDDIVIDDITMDVIDHVREHRSHNRGEFRNLVADFMLSNGDITQEELDTLKAERSAVKEELKALKESGDQDAFRARLTELREARAAHREDLKAYIQSNEELAAAIELRRELIRERRGEIQERRERRERRQNPRDEE